MQINACYVILIKKIIQVYYEFYQKLGGGSLLGKEKISGNRNFGIDLLKIVATLMVVVLHILGDGGVLLASSTTLQNYLVWFLEGFSYCAVNIFALITGFLLVGRKTNYSRFFNLLFEIIFYSIVVSTVFCFLMPDKYNFKNIVFELFSLNWYIKVYLVTFFFIPFFNRLINGLTKKSFGVLVLTIVSLLCLWTTVISFFGDDRYVTNFGYNLVWLSGLYFFGAYIKKYGVAVNVKKVWLLVIYFGAGLLTVAWKFIFSQFPQVSEFFGRDISMVLMKYTSPTVLIMAVSLLLFFSRLKIKEFIKKPIALVAGLSFSVYVIHTNTAFYRELIVNKFTWLTNYNAFFTVGLVLISAIIIFLGCVIIDYLRGLLFRLVRINKLEKITGDFLDKRINIDKVDEEAEMLEKAKFQQERNEDIKLKRAEKVEMLSQMTDEEIIAYYRNLQKENDEFLQSLGIKREDISTDCQSSEERDEQILERIKDLQKKQKDGED